MENQIIDKFLKGRAVSSARIYRHEIGKFSAFLSALGKDISNAGTGELDAYHMELSNRNLTPATMKRAFSMITGFLKFQAKQNPEYHAPVSARGDLIKYSSACYAESDQFKDILAKFGKWIQTDGTRGNYLPAIQRFFAITGKSPENIIHDDILNWVNRLHGQTRQKYARDMSGRTICIHLSAISKFSRFLKLHGLPAVPAELLRKESVNLPRRSGHQKPQTLTPEELQTLLSVTRNAKTKIAARDHALFTLVFCCALRVGEALNMKTGHILFDSDKVRVSIHGRKNKRDITQELEFADKRDRKLLQTVKDWIALAGLSPADPLFPRCPWDRLTHGHDIKTGTRITQRQADYRFSLWSEDAGIRKMDQHMVIHTLRHTRATDLLKNRNWDLAQVRNFLGHANVATTDIYLH